MASTCELQRGYTSLTPFAAAERGSAEMIFAGLAIAFMALLVALAPIIDGNKRVGSSGWRVLPSRSGKSWEAYRWVGFGRTECRNRFKSRTAAEEWVRKHNLG